MITIPSQHYIGLKPERDTESSLPLAFATPFGTDAAFEKRKSTVDNWCRGYGTYVNGKYVYPEFDAKVHDNELMEGFRIAESVRRTGWNGGNVVWRVVDPRGFELEISSANFARIVDCTTIVNGEIKGKCIWGRDGAANVLLPEASEPYQQAAANTKRSTMKIDMKSLAVGDEVEFKDGQIWVYLGVYSTLSRKESKMDGGRGYSTTYKYELDVKKRHVFGARIDKAYAIANEYRLTTSKKQEGDWRYYVAADTKKIATIVKKNAEVIDMDAIAADMTIQYERYTNVIESASRDYLTFAAIPGNVKISDLTLSLEKAVDNPEHIKIVQYNGSWFYAYTSTTREGNWQLCYVSADLVNGTYTQRNHIDYTLRTLDGVEMYNFTVTYKNNQYRF